jgi:hypothetical protein
MKATTQTGFRTKLWGLKKIRKIHLEAKRQGITLNSRGIPYYVFSNPNQVQAHHVQGAERILIRTDFTKTKMIQTSQEWSYLKRTETTEATNGNVNKVRECMRALTPTTRKKTRFILHPTKLRKRIHFSASINKTSTGEIYLDLKIPGETEIHRQVPGTKIKLKIKNGKVMVSKNFIRSVLFTIKPKLRAFVENAVSFLNEGIRQRQINISPKSKPFELWCCSFKGEEGFPEFFDFLEGKASNREPLF